MRIINGFVTNSSSSSFIICLPKDVSLPRNPKGFLKTLFGEDKELDGFFEVEEYDGYDSVEKKVKKKIVEYPFSDVIRSLMENVESVRSKEKIKDLLDSGYLTQFEDYDDRVKLEDYLDIRKYHSMPESTDEEKKAKEEFWDVGYEKYRKEYDAWRSELIESVMNNEMMKDKKYYTFGYSDNDGSFGSFMEHEMPQHIIHPVVRISQH